MPTGDSRSSARRVQEAPAGAVVRLDRVDGHVAAPLMRSGSAG